MSKHNLVITAGQGHYLNVWDWKQNKIMSIFDICSHLELDSTQLDNFSVRKIVSRGSVVMAVIDESSMIVVMELKDNELVFKSTIEIGNDTRIIDAAFVNADIYLTVTSDNSHIYRLHQVANGVYETYDIHEGIARHIREHTYICEGNEKYRLAFDSVFTSSTMRPQVAGSVPHETYKQMMIRKRKRDFK